MVSAPISSDPEIGFVAGFSRSLPYYEDDVLTTQWKYMMYLTVEWHRRASQILQRVLVAGSYLCVSGVWLSHTTARAFPESHCGG
jgi:hypothetical protein